MKARKMRNESSGLMLEQILGEKIILSVELVRVLPPEEHLGVVCYNQQTKAHDFIEPIYKPSALEVSLAIEQAQKEEINPNNPILFIYAGVNAAEWFYDGIQEGIHRLHGAMYYRRLKVLNDAHPEFEKYARILLQQNFQSM